MAANVDSPKRRSARLQRGSNEEVAPSSGRRISDPRTRLSAGGSSVERPRRGSKGQNPGSSQGGSPELQGARGQRPPQCRTNEKSVKTRRSREVLQDDERQAEAKTDRRLTPPMVNREKSDAGSAPSPQKSQEHVGKIEVRASASTGRTEGGGAAGPSVERTRTDVEEAEPPGGCRAASGDNAQPSNQSVSRDKENVNVLSPSRRLVCDTKSPVRNTGQGRSDASSAPPRDSKVQCSSKQLLQELMGMCAEFSKELLDSQKYLNQEQKQLEQRNFTWNFETAFQDNVSINGQSWHEAPDTTSEPDLKILEDQLDGAIVETAMKRKRHPRKILGHFVRGLKTEREILGQYKPLVQPKELKLDSRCESRMTEQAVTTAAISQQIKETMKALPAQLEKAEGFSQVLNLQPALQGSRLRHDIFSSQVVIQDVIKTLPEEVETTPEENEPAENIAPVRNVRRQQSPSIRNDLYPLRSKRKISLEG